MTRTADIPIWPTRRRNQWLRKWRKRYGRTKTGVRP